MATMVLLVIGCCIIGGTLLKGLEAYLTAPHSRTRIENKLAQAALAMSPRINRAARPAVASDLPMPEQFDPHWTVTQELDIWGYEFTKCECTKCEIRKTEQVREDRRREQIIADETRKWEREKEITARRAKAAVQLQQRTRPCQICNAQVVGEEICVDCFRAVNTYDIPRTARGSRYSDGSGFDRVKYQWNDQSRGVPMSAIMVCSPNLAATAITADCIMPNETRLQFDKPEFDYAESDSPKEGGKGSSEEKKPPALIPRGAKVPGWARSYVSQPEECGECGSWPVNPGHEHFKKTAVPLF